MESFCNVRLSSPSVLVPCALPSLNACLLDAWGEPSRITTVPRVLPDVYAFFLGVGAIRNDCGTLCFAGHECTYTFARCMGGGATKNYCGTMRVLPSANTHEHLLDARGCH